LYINNGKEFKMVICPKCKAENRPEAAFCAQCGTILFSQPGPSKPAEQAAPLSSPGLLTPSVSASQTAPVPVMEPPVYIPKFTRRPAGATFGGRFLYNSVIFQDDHDIHYTVTEINQPDAAGVRICSNHECRTIHCPIGSETENFCTQCGQALELQAPLLMLQEADTDKFKSIQPVIDLQLVHPNIHPPIATFQEDIHGSIRYCLVTPYSQNLPTQPEISMVLDWGEQLAKALDYLQTKGIVLGEEFDPSIIGLADGIVVWRNFNAVRVLPLLTDREKINNMRLLALAMYSWMTGKTIYSLDPYLPPVINDLFQKALVGEGFTSGAEFEQQINQAKSTGPAHLNLDYQVGRRTHTGKVRTNNEDSMFSLELTKVVQGNIIPICLIAVADGMGGHASGELASSLVTETIAHMGASELVTLQNKSVDEYGEWIKRAMYTANQAVYKARQDAGNDMGSTLVLGLITGSQAYLGHLGDSRIYLLSKGSFEQLTTDHSLVQHLISMGKISQDEARFHPQKNVIYRSLGENPEAVADYFSQQLFPGDRLLFCSDGLTNSMDDQKIQKIIVEADSPQAACDQLIDEVNKTGGEDNITVVMIEVLSF
jgi:serine/threonine protein phosphatase PrpC